MAREIASEVVGELLTELCRAHGADASGDLAAYIPPLALADPGAFGLALVSREGHRYQAGDAEIRFTIQSVSKPFVYALALTELGLAEVTRHVGTEPSGEAFNAISLEPGTGRPANPMINAGAIATTGMLAAEGPEERFTRVLDVLGRFAGRGLDVDEEVYRAEAQTGDRNRALAHLMRASGSLRCPPTEAAEVYFRQCAVLVDTVDVAVMAATLAAGGLNPVTGEQVVPEPVAVQVLAVMATCGMYDGSGEWLLRVGLPAKSGVSGGVIAVSPGRFGVAGYSPPLDAAGNSVRVVSALRELSDRFGLHLMHNPAPSAPTVTEAWRDGGRLALVAAQGALDFTAAERVVHAVGACLPDEQPGCLVLDLHRVTDADAAALALLRGVIAAAASTGLLVGLVAAPDMTLGDRATVHDSRDAAIAWAATAG
ncbi:glutaminase A [Streptacidiphilus melanogenes]|uniref:glutaminase A n=1 Tax=Streptacidiphilus melanogenes TaxID=411235 RepID=UPI0005AA8821|nr:glutaminase A [Streptacidiphilus melanogenes]